ncbi:50S ribosomal protein L24 [Anoxybacter fermentans]|uniref:Large ribosomal subunit protein uL24 n=1 Tax=Anoxybacter fermentans TaxID=1323375 RepID=A0A3S9T347_9FIRM|nr:50S ribosomal protein L24 [Anoxybacter fermentans]AZR74968.1 50S ribosomal protein L24 [Anoxybacter fermentans]
MHVKKGDTVMVIAGKDKGKKGKILKVYPKKSRVVVEGVNIVHRHTKPSQQFPQGGIIENEAPIHVSNVQLVCPRCNEAARTGKRILDDGKKVRYCKKCGEVVDK